MTRPRLILVLYCLPLLLILHSGCAPDVDQQYVPKASDARKAVETALSEWKSGAEHGTISSSSSKVKIDVIDARWQIEKRKLESYRIIEEITGKPLPQFKVQLKMVGKPEETTTYLVVGIDPLQVWSEVDHRKSFGDTTRGM